MTGTRATAPGGGTALGVRASRVRAPRPGAEAAPDRTAGTVRGRRTRTAEPGPV